MRGILRKTNIWQVEYQVVNSFRFLPLHPDNVSSIMMDADSSVNLLNGLEVEFEIVKEYIDSHTNQVQAYALMVGRYLNSNTFTEEQVRKAIVMSATSPTDNLMDRCDEIINHLKKSKL